MSCAINIYSQSTLSAESIWLKGLSCIKRSHKGHYGIIIPISSQKHVLWSVVTSKNLPALLMSIQSMCFFLTTNQKSFLLDYPFCSSLSAAMGFLRVFMQRSNNIDARSWCCTVVVRLHLRHMPWVRIPSHLRWNWDFHFCWISLPLRKQDKP